MDEGPRYPGSLVMQHAKQQAWEIVDKYRRRRKRATELPRAVSLLLAWEGAIVAGAFLAAIAHVAASAYMMERFDERTRRTSLVRYYQQRTDMAAEAVQQLQASITYYSHHANTVERHLESSTAAARECRARMAERRRQLEHELTQGLGLPAGPCSGDSGRDMGRSWLLAVTLAPWWALYVRWRLAGWRRELEGLDREARRLEQSLAHDQQLADQARAKLRCLARELRREAAAHQALHCRLQAWRGYSCRRLVFSGGGQLQPPGLRGLLGNSWNSGARQSVVPRAADQTSTDGGGGGGRSTGDDGNGEGSGGSGVMWSWMMQVYSPAWMDEDEGFDHPPPPPRGEALGDRDNMDEEEAGDDEGEQPRAGGGAVSTAEEFPADLEALLRNALPRW